MGREKESELGLENFTKSSPGGFWGKAESGLLWCQDRMGMRNGFNEAEECLCRASYVKVKNLDFIQALKSFYTGSDLVSSDLKRQKIDSFLESHEAGSYAIERLKPRPEEWQQGGRRGDVPRMGMSSN